MRQVFNALAFSLARAGLRPLLSWMRYRTAPADPASSLRLDPNRPVCYVLPTRSWIDALALDRICRDCGLPVPQRTGQRLPRVGYPARVYLPALLEARSGRTPLAALLQSLTDGNSDLQVVPVSVFWGRDPGQETSLLRLIFADSAQAGWLRKFFILLVNGRNVLVHFGAALSLRAFVDAEADPSRAVRKATRTLRLHFLRARTAALGPTLLRRGVVIRGVLEAPAVRRAIAREAVTRGVGEERVRTRARRLASEIAADYSATAIRALELVLNWIWQRVFRAVEVRGLERVREQAAAGREIVYLPSHRSHADYLLVSYLLYRNGLVPPHIAAGINLNFWPIGGLLRRGGAFYMRRKFGGDALYTAVFRAYVDSLIRRGYPLEFFPEGGRSRTGRLLPPKTGLLSMVVDSALRNRARTTALVPVFIAYDKVFELGSYFKELRGGAKTPESGAALLKAGRILGKSHGGAYLNFGEPVLLQDYADVHLPEWRAAMPTGGDERPAEFSAFVDRLANELMRRVNTFAVAAPVALTACALLAAPHGAAGEDELLEQIDHLLGLLAVWPRAEQLLVPVAQSAAVLEHALPVARARRVPHPWGDLLAVTGRDAVLLTYSRNTVQHLFALPALIASFFRTRSRLPEEAVLTGCRALYPFLRREFFLPWEPADCDTIARACLARMGARGLLLAAEEGSWRRPDVSQPAFGALSALGRALGETLERYAMALLLLADEQRAGATVSRERFESDCRLLAQRLAVLTGREAPEFFDRVLFRGYLDSLVDVGLVVERGGGRLTLDPRIERIAERSIELLSDESRQTLLQLLARRRRGT